MTSQNSNPPTSQKQICGVADSPAKTSQSPGEAQDSEGHGQVFFTKSLGLLAWYDRESSSWKTSQRSLAGEWEPFVESWPRSGTMRNGRLYRRQPLGLSTDATVFGLWPTPTTPGGGITLPPGTSRTGRTPDGRKKQVGLAQAVRLWPTPTVQDSANNGGPSQFDRNSLPLNAAVKVWPTPNSRDWKGPPGAGCVERGGRGASLPASVGGTLNPAWVEWLMGYPVGWTDLDCAAPVQFNIAVEPDIPRLANKCSRRVARLKGLGNAVVPQVVEWIGQRLDVSTECRKVLDTPPEGCGNNNNQRRR